MALRLAVHDEVGTDLQERMPATFNDEQQARCVVREAVRDAWLLLPEELGHGSNVRGLETTATYNNFSDTFTLHSPTLTSLEFWTGSLGLNSNNAVVIAQLIIDGKSYGNHNFLVQLREVSERSEL